ncbi:MAG TPA: hypothetical protein VLX30_14690 [Burkholderiales bacterium]|nr:hypothetical protein [Burkholderiales bacterium]
MNLKKLGLPLAFGLAAIAASGSALADHGHVHFGLYFGMPVWGPGYYPAPYYYPPAPYYYPPAVVVPSAPQTYVEQGPAQGAPEQPQGYWYYCADAKAYYPYVKQCPGGWQRVAPQPGN